MAAPTREDLFWGHSYLSLSLSLSPTRVSLQRLRSHRSSSSVALFAAFQSGKFSNAITLPPCVCLDKGIMRFYARCACFHGIAVVYAPAFWILLKTSRASRGSSISIHLSLPALFNATSISRLFLPFCVSSMCFDRLVVDLLRDGEDVTRCCLRKRHVAWLSCFLWGRIVVTRSIRFGDLSGCFLCFLAGTMPLPDHFEGGGLNVCGGGRVFEAFLEDFFYGYRGRETFLLFGYLRVL